MDIRKIAVVGGVAVAAALAFAPLAAADDLSTTVESEITLLNDTFLTDTFLTGNYADVVYHTGGLDTIKAADAPVSGTTFLDYVLYGISPIKADESTIPGAYDVSNGAAVEFDDAYNVFEYSQLNGGELAPAADLLGSSTTIAAALGTDSVSGAFATFFDQGVADLLGSFGIPSA